MKRFSICTCFVLFFCATSVAQINTGRKHIGISNAFFMGISSTMSSMEDYMDANTETHKNLTLGRGGFSFEADAFLFNNMAYHIKLSPYVGREVADIKNDEISMLGFNSLIGLEYYFNLGGNNKLSIGAGVGYDVFGYFYNNRAARYSNYNVPISVTFWHNRLGFALSYEPCFSKGEPHNNASMLPKMAPNFVSVSVRLK